MSKFTIQFFGHTSHIWILDMACEGSTLSEDKRSRYCGSAVHIWKLRLRSSGPSLKDVWFLFDLGKSLFYARNIDQNTRKPFLPLLWVLKG